MIYRRDRATFMIDRGFDVRIHANITGGSDIFVDVVFGNNGNTGLSWAQAKRDLWNALAVVTDGGTIHIASGRYEFENNYGGHQGSFGNKNLNFIGYGDVILQGTHRITVWNLDTNHYEAIWTADIRAIWDESIVNPDDTYYQLTKVGDEATVDATPGTFWWDVGANLIHLHLSDSRAPDMDVQISQANQSCALVAAAAPGRSTYFENIEFRYSGNLQVRCYQTAGVVQRAYFRNCVVSQKGYIQNSVSIDGVTEAILLDCTIRDSTGSGGGDGIDGSSLGGIASRVIEAGCTIYNIRGQNNDQCSSMHDGSDAVRINCVYHDSQGQIIAEDDVGNYIWMLGCRLSDSDIGYGYWGSNAWLDACNIHDCATADVKSVGMVRIRRLIHTGILDTAAGTIESY